jgi:mannose-6-phosphate isomerase class I
LPFTGINSNWRVSVQELLPLKKEVPGRKDYDIYPTVKTRDNLIFCGFESLADKAGAYRNIIIESYVGVFIDHFAEKIADILRARGYTVSVTLTSAYFKTAGEMDLLAGPFLGDADPLFGKRTTLNLEDLFNHNFDSIQPKKKSDINIIAGPGASLAGWEGILLYVDIPKNEIQFRARAGSIANLGLVSPGDPTEMYKRFYFFDWIILNRHKQTLICDINILIDGQRPEMPVWISGQTFRSELSAISRSPFRARPWFEPGAWGGSWMKGKFAGLNREAPNFAWSFELISPENGIILESSGYMLEFSFDFLMYHAAQSLLGENYRQYGNDFPIRFDFLDTFDGGNLSIQCHPLPGYIKSHFGEPFTQEETYYILDSKEDSSVFLGFREDIDPVKFREKLESSFAEQKAIDPAEFVLSHPSRKHDLFLIPYGTIHGSAKNNLVLEISTTPYIFTFKLYDWVRPDLNGRLRNLNIARGFENLFFDRKGAYVNEKLISKPVLLEEGKGWKLFDLPTHETHSYSVHRYHFTGEIEIKTNNKCLVMSLVEGNSITVKDLTGVRMEYSFAETFIVPASSERVRILNRSGKEAILVEAFIK